ncbi:FAD-dependent oxidoreductase [Castellaniella sp. GW247-6E4]|uniref:NAD(P)/FAD-dependent oxidoreductase n=1 Tax=Castellaniella sp. GW247-6E4 TaxID=3140380 RepID=UPI0033146A1A
MASHFNILIVGGGQAARRAAFAAHTALVHGTIGILGEEPHPPYDRPPLSKQALLRADGIEACTIIDSGTYAQANIRLLLGDAVVRVQRDQHLVHTRAGDQYHYDRLVLATGSRPRRLPLPDEISHDVFYLRTKDDAVRLGARLRAGARVVVVGAGFIGLEVAAAARSLECQVDVIDRAPHVLSRILPAHASQAVQAFHRTAGVGLHLGAALDRISRNATGGLCITLTQADERPLTLQADILVVGIGVVPNVELAQEAGLEVGDGILVDACGRTSDPDVLAGGEVTAHPVAGRAGRHRIESWQVAELQAEAAGATAAGAPKTYESLPWFWSDQSDLNIQMLGHTPANAHWVLRGPKDAAHSWFALDREQRIVGVVSFNSGRDISAARRAIQSRRRIAPELLADPARAWRELLSQPAPDAHHPLR